MPTNTYDVLENVVDFSTKFLQPSETPQTLFDVVSTGASLKDTKFHWWEQKRKPRVTTLTADYVPASGLIKVVSVAPFVTGSIVGIGSMAFRVISVSGLDVTVVLVDGSDVSATSGTAVTVLSNAQVESSDGSLTTRNDKIKVENVTQIMREVAKVSMSQIDTSKEVGGQEMLEQVAQIIKGFRQDSGTMLWNSFKVDPSDNNSARIAGGIPYFVAQNGHSDTGALTGANVTSFIRSIYDEVGGKPKELWMNPATQTTFSGFDASYFRRDANSGTRGVVATEFVTLNGEQLTIKTDVNIPVNKVYALNSSDIVFRPLRNLKSSPLGKKGDFMEVEVVAEISVEVNPSNQMGVFTIA